MPKLINRPKGWRKLRIGEMTIDGKDWCLGRPDLNPIWHNWDSGWLAHRNRKVDNAVAVYYRKIKL